MICGYLWKDYRNATLKGCGLFGIDVKQNIKVMCEP